MASIQGQPVTAVPSARVSGFPNILVERLGELPSPEGELEASEMTARLSEALEQVPARWRTALILQYRYGLTYAEIADRLGVSSNMVKKYLAQGLGHCRQQMAQSE